MLDLWDIGGSYPGAGGCDSASNLNVPTTIIVNSVIPNALAGLDFNCSGCVIDIQAGGQLTIGGPSSLSNGAILKVDGGTLVVNDTLTFQSSAQLHLLDGTISGSGNVAIASDATLLWDSTSSPTFDTLTINNAGVFDLQPTSPASLNLVNNVTINNSGLMSIGPNVTAINCGSASIISNTGTLQKQGGDMTTIFAAVNNVAGAPGVTVDSGTLALADGGTGDAPFAINGGGVLEFPSGTYTMGTGGVVSGSGTLMVSGGTLSIGGVTEPFGFSISAGTLTGPGFLSVDRFDWSGGTITGAGGTELAGNGSGTISGADGPMVLDGRTFNDYGFINYTATGNSLTLDNGAVLNIFGTFEIQSDGTINTNDTSSTINISPNGQLVKSTSAGLAILNPQTNNNATVLAAQGAIEFRGDGNHTGAFFVDPGAQINFNASSTSINGGFVGGDGAIAFTGGVTTIDGAFYQPGNTIIEPGADVFFFTGAGTIDLQFNGGNLVLADVFALIGNGSWSGGTLGNGDAAGEFVVTDTATLTIDAANGNATINGTLLTNDGTINYTSNGSPAGQLELANGSAIDNNGTFDIQGDNAAIANGGVIIIDGLVGPNTFNNSGTLKKTGAGGTTTFDPELNNTGTVLAESGTIHFTSVYNQTAGTTTLGSGNISTDSQIDINAGVLNGEGTITGNLFNKGEVAPGSSPGTINVTGNYTQDALGLLSIEIAAGQFDLLNVTGNVTLDGTLTATLIGGYQPPNGTTFDVMTFATRTGDFATYVPPTYPGGGSIQKTFTPTTLRLSAVVVPPSVDLAIGMTGPASVNAGTALAYDITITNNGPDAHSGTITVANTLPVGATGVGFTGTGWICGAPLAGVITCTNSTALPNGNSLAVLTISMTAPPNPGGVTNSATVSSPIADPNGANNTASVNTNVIAQSDLSISKNDAGDVTSGQNIVYTIVVTNNGPSQATGVSVADPTPANLTFVSNSGACTGAFPCNLGTLNNGQSATITSTFSTSPSFSGDVTNTATVSSTTGDPTAGNNPSSETTNVGAQANLSVTKIGPATANLGQDITYTINFTNNGPSPATNVTVSDPTPVGLAFLSNSGACATSYPCNVGTLNAGQSGSITSTYTVPGNYSGATIVNTATISSDINDPATSDNTSSVTTTVNQQADLSINKSGPPSTSPGQLVTYAITVTNLGPSSASSVVVTDPTPPGLVFVSNSGACTTAYPCNLGTLTSGQSATINTMFSVPPAYASASIVNTASVSSSTSDTNSGNNSSTVTTPVIAQADLSIVKTGPAFFSTGSNIVYTIIVTNAGPLAAANTIVNDATPSGLAFVSNSGACATAFPCNLGTLTSGQSVTITSTFSVPPSYPGASITNTATVSTSSTDLNTPNNTSTVITPLAGTPPADLVISKSGPPDTNTNAIVDFTIVVTNNGPSAATSVIVNDPTPAGLQFVVNGGACTTPFPCAIPTLAANASFTITARYFVTASSGTTITNTATVDSGTPDPNPANSTSSAQVLVVPLVACPSQAPTQTAPANGASVTTPVGFTWTGVPNAIGYLLTITGPGAPAPILTGGTFASVALPNGSYSWTVTAFGPEACPPVTSAPRTFIVCNLVSAPLASVIGESTTGQTYAVSWTAVANAAGYELQEANNGAFTGATITTVAGTSRSFTKAVTTATPFFYRVRALSNCTSDTPFSPTIHVSVLPVPVPGGRTVVSVPFGSTTPVTFQIFIPGLPAGNTSFIATADRPWLAVLPISGIVPPEGMLLTVSIDPTNLPNGTWTGTIIVVYGAVTVTGGVQTDASTTSVSVPVSINLVTPVTPVSLTTPATNALVIPSVGHLIGSTADWRSDIRLANISSLVQDYLLTFNAGSGDQTAALQQTTISVAQNATTALDDIVRNWYGIGSLGESSDGVLTIQPVSQASGLDVSKFTVVSSRTYNAATSGTLGQFIPAIPFSGFLGRLAGFNSILSLQQVAQTSASRTNLGLVEAFGKSASVTVSVFDGAGARLLDVPIALAAGEQKQLNSFLAQHGLTLDNARIEVRADGGDGLVTAYASVVDNFTNDPLLVSGLPIGGEGTNRYVVAGIAHVNTGSSDWRSDLRVFNAGVAPRTTTLTFYPNGNPAGSISKTVAVNPGEVKALDDVLAATFGLETGGGTLHVTTDTNTPLIVTARTFDQKLSGTVGQFIPAVTTDEAVGTNGRSLQILHVEESSRYRTNLGIAEITGHPVVVEISVSLPDSKVSPRIQVPLDAFESIQLPVLSGLGLGATYNARLSVSVTEGTGKVTAYGSVIDLLTKDPTYVPAQ